jgi:hypothetical protein
LEGIESVLGRLLAAAEVRRDRVLSNVPPAWVHHVRLDAGCSMLGAGLAGVGDDPARCEVSS